MWWMTLAVQEANGLLDWANNLPEGIEDTMWIC